MDIKILTQSLSMDLLRVALGLHRGSLKMAERFKQESQKACNEITRKNPNQDLSRLLNKTQAVLARDDEHVAEDALMYSTLLRNFALKKL